MGLVETLDLRAPRGWNKTATAKNLYWTWPPCNVKMPASAPPKSRTTFSFLIRQLSLPSELPAFKLQCPGRDGEG
eukprot:3767832-Rhodomonas_salina.3